MWKFFNEVSQKNILEEVNVNEIVLIRFFDSIRKCCVKKYQENQVYLGGEGIFCQIDESLFRHKPKYHRGRVNARKIWVLLLQILRIHHAKFICKK
jgi:hypothetical protein